MECQAKHGGEVMAFTLVTDALWNEIEPLLPVEPPKPDGGRPRVADRACLTGIVFVLRSGLPWRMLPTEMGCGSGVTCWRRLRDWTAAGVWPEIHAKLLNILGRKKRIKLSRAVIDSASVRALFGGPTPARTQQIVRKRGANGT
jgi:transposase